MPTSVLTPLREFVPVSDKEWVFFLVSLSATLAAFFWVTRVYATSAWRVYLTALLISWIPVQVLAFVFEGRKMWLPGEHSAVFFWGDSVLLPMIAVSCWAMRRTWVEQNPNGFALADKWQWRVFVALVALGVAAAYHATQVTSWPPTNLRAPSKLWHDMAVYPIFIYFLASQAPFLWQVRWDALRVRQIVTAGTCIAGFAGWVWLGHVYDPSQVHERRPLLVIASGADSQTAHPPDFKDSSDPQSYYPSDTQAPAHASVAT